MAVTKRTCERCLVTFYGDSRFCEDCIARMESIERRKRIWNIVGGGIGILIFSLLMIWFFLGFKDEDWNFVTFVLILFVPTLVSGLILRILFPREDP